MGSFFELRSGFFEDGDFSNADFGDQGVFVRANTVVPEPSTYALLVLSGAGLAAYRLRRHTRR